MRNNPTPAEYVDYTWAGLVRAAALVSCWATLLAASLFWFRWSTGNWWFPVVAVPTLTFLYVGLFITAHDAMHRSLAPKHPRLNAAIGQMCVLLYGLFSYSLLTRSHFEHHAEPASETDPDYHRGSERFWPWYLGFMLRYMSWRQWLGMPAIFFSLLLLGAPLANVVVFWGIPAITSSLQLFYFGTYRPHLTPPGGFRDHHRASSSGYSNLWSLLTCYHFGRHWEHHAYPFVPWWKLGRVRVDEQAGEKVTQSEG